MRLIANSRLATLYWVTAAGVMAPLATLERLGVGLPAPVILAPMVLGLAPVLVMGTGMVILGLVTKEPPATQETTVASVMLARTPTAEEAGAADRAAVPTATDAKHWGLTIIPAESTLPGEAEEIFD